MRVLEVISSLGPLGGGETFAVNFCREIVSFADLKVVILYTQNREHFIRRLQEKGIEPIILDKHGHFDFSVTKTIASIITDFKPNVIHTENNALISAFLAQKRVSKHLRAPVFHTMHLMPKEECFHPLVRIMYKHIFRSRGYTPVALTKKHANASEQFYHLESVPYVENGIDLEPFRNENPLLGRNYDVAVVGRFSVEKNHRFLIPAFKRLKERYPSLKVALVGDGDLFEETRALADRLGTLDYIEFTGPLENPSKVVSDSKIICLGSLFEANPLSLLEGMAAGCIAVSSDVGGVSDIVKEGKNGFTFECGNEDAFVSILEKVLNNTKDYVSMSDYNRTYANRFSMRNCAYNYFKLFGGKEG